MNDPRILMPIHISINERLCGVEQKYVLKRIPIQSEININKSKLDDTEAINNDTNAN